MEKIVRHNLPASSLIVCSRNRPELLWETVESVLESQKLPTEIIVIDQSDAPHPRLATLIGKDDCEIRYFWTQSVGVSLGRNRGAALARHEILVFTDDDMLATPTWYRGLIQALLELGPATVITGQVLASKEDTPGGFAPSTKQTETSTVYKGRIGEDVLYTGNMALFRSTFTQIGGFDERLGPGTLFPAAEDNDLGFRLLEAGYRIIYEPRAVIYHRAWRAADDYIPLKWRYGCGQGAYYAKHISLKDRYMLWRMCLDILRRGFSLLDGSWRRPREACGQIAFITGIMFGILRWAWTQGRAYR